ncbi:hypothetical protein [Streptomyces sp. NPDC001054]
MKLTAALLDQLLDAPHEDPVIYLERDDDSGKVTGLDVWAEALVPHGDIVVRREELADQLGDDPQGAERTAALQHLAGSWQADIDAALEAS